MQLSADNWEVVWNWPNNCLSIAVWPPPPPRYLQKLAARKFARLARPLPSKMLNLVRKFVTLVIFALCLAGTVHQFCLRTSKLMDRPIGTRSYSDPLSPDLLPSVAICHGRKNLTIMRAILRDAGLSYNNYFIGMRRKPYLWEPNREMTTLSTETLWDKLMAVDYKYWNNFVQ